MVDDETVVASLLAAAKWHLARRGELARVYTLEYVNLV